MSICERSVTARHHASSEPARHRRGTSSSVSTRRPASVTTLRSSSGSARRNGPGAAGSGRSVSPSSTADRPAAVIQSFSSADAQTASPARPPGFSTRAISARARDGSGTSMIPKRQMTPSTAPSRRLIAEASSTRNSTFATPSSAARRRAASTISGATSVESSSPFGPSRSAAMKPVSPGPAASSSTVSPGAGSSRATMRSSRWRVTSRPSAAWRSQPAAAARQASTCSCSGVVMWSPARIAE